jgi:hypothetical protein
MPDPDLFYFFRYSLSWLVTIYATVLTLYWAWGWVVWLSGGDKHVSLLRSYVIVHGLRLRFTSFWPDLVVCLLLCVAFLIMWRLHGLVEQGML